MVDMGTIDKINDKFKVQIATILTGIAEALREDGWKVGEICDMSCDDYRYSILASQYDANPSELNEDDVDITFEICESEEYDGTTSGVNFAIQVVTVGGRIIGGVYPHNYTDECWVDRGDGEAVEKRFDLIAQLDPDGMVSLLEDYKDY